MITREQGPLNAAEVPKKVVEESAIHTFLTDLSQTEGASDLLITVGKPPQLRIHNEIVSLDYEKLTPNDTKEFCLLLLNEEKTRQFLLEKELDITVSLGGSGRYRVNMYQQRGSMAMVARMIPHRAKSFEELRLPQIIVHLADIPNGLILVTGATGSGKSSTVAAIIDHINQTRSCHIVTIEDPIEYIHSHDQSTVDQREVASDTNSFSEALRRVLRQSPDVVMIGEIRDRESAQVAITLAETGHLTLSTLHTRGAVATIDRLIDMFPPEQHSQIRAQLSASLVGVVWQRLLPRIDQKGLVVACEVMIMTPAIRALIRKANTHEIYSAIQAGRKFGMCTMEYMVASLAEKGLIDESWSNNSD